MITLTNAQIGTLNKGKIIHESSIEAKGKQENKSVMGNIPQTFSRPIFYTDVNAKITDIANTQNLSSFVDDNAIITATSYVQNDKVTMNMGDQNEFIKMEEQKTNKFFQQGLLLKMRQERLEFC